MEFGIGIHILKRLRKQIVLCTLLFSHSAFAVVLQTIPEVLSKVCPEPSKFEKKNTYLGKDQVQKLNENLEYKMDERGTLVTFYECTTNGKIQNTSYIDTHEVRKEKETLMIVVSSSGEISDIEVLQFEEPKEYMPPSLWMKQYDGKTKKDMEHTKSNIVGITGATLTSKAISKSVQKILAVHAMLYP